MVLNYDPLTTETFLHVIQQEMPTYKLSRKTKGHKYYEISAAFDIEVSSWYAGNDKQACMYVWQFGINGHVCIGRTWDEFTALIKSLSACMGLCDDTVLCVYVHNLAYEFQFIRKRFTWLNVFAVKSRTPVYALADCGIEFRCSYILSGYALSAVARNLQSYSIRKLTGDLDYSLIRHSKTPLTEQEKQYCVNDVLIVMAYVEECMMREGSIAKIPITKTGYVRRYVRKECFFEQGKPSKRSIKRLRYAEMIKALNLDAEQYTMLKRAFSGGYTHASAYYSGQTVKDVTSYDFTSSYPYVLVSEQFPMSAGRKVSISSKEQFTKCLRCYACMFDLELYGVSDTFLHEHYISRSKCYICENAVTDNGRIVSADHIILTITEQDYLIIAKTYRWNRAIVHHMYIYDRGYLPTDIIRCILKLYADKTSLKGVQGKEVEYMSSKEMLNSVYGMMVTDIVRDEIIYDNDTWTDMHADIETCINKYNGGFGRFLFYPWGVWCTAYARRNLWTGILACADDYIYSDTDSIKIINADMHADYINSYNDRVRIKLMNACEHHKIPFTAVIPKTNKGIDKLLGVWDFDGHYERFKTLGAKRYMTETNDGINITVSGLNKQKTVPYLCRDWYTSVDGTHIINDPFDRFNDGLYVPADYTGKLTHTYIDDAIIGTVTDYTGIESDYNELSCIHMEGSEYTMGLAQEYIDFIMQIQEV